MLLTATLPILAEDPAVPAATLAVGAGGDLEIVAPSGARAPLLATLMDAERSRPLVVVTATGRDADELHADVAAAGGRHDDELARGDVHEGPRDAGGRVEAVAQRPLEGVGRPGGTEGEDGVGVEVGEHEVTFPRTRRGRRTARRPAAPGSRR